MITQAEQNVAATKFANDWRNIGDEKSDSQRYWIEFFTNVLGIENVTQKIEFEKRVIVDGQTKFIDVYIPETRTLIEQKSIDKDLTKEYPQSGGWSATPFEQARRYSQWLPHEENARWIVACNFKTFEIHDMNKPNDQPVVVELDEMRNKLPMFDFMFRKEVKEINHEMEVSIEAGKLVGLLYDGLLEQYIDPDEESLKSLNALCVRLVFCLYAEDAGIFGGRDMFHDYLQDVPVHNIRKALVELFKVLDTKPEERDKYLAQDNPKLAAFPYVNGGLFANENIEIPPFTDELKNLLLKNASEDFDWKDISPTIFGAVFESTLNPETRRSGGMHYTSIENIHKVIDPLFLDDLKAEFEEIRKVAVKKTRETKLKAFQTKIASLKFLDPACGSGNFLTETYISLRRLENDILEELQGGQIVFGLAVNPIQVSIGQFFGIEINDFAVTVAKTALWIAESQMIKETENVVHMTIDFLPLKSYANIVEGNALQMHWEEVVPRHELSYIMGNPPFVGARLMNSLQKQDVLQVFGNKWKNVGNLDYVSCWYKKSVDLMKGTTVQTALVSTNSISQGASVSILWKPLFEEGVHIDFAYRTFRWDSEAKIKAHVHCVIVGFSLLSTKKNKVIYTEEKKYIANNINGYLLDAENVFIDSRKKSICSIPAIGIGNMPVDGGNYLFTEEEKNLFEEKEPMSKKWFRPWVGSQEFINRTTRFCLYLGECSPAELRKMPECLKRVENVKNFRMASSRASTRKLAAQPLLFSTTNIPTNNYVLIPKVSSEQRRYIPMGFMKPETLSSDLVFIIPEASLYHFGILTSNVHMAWTRAVCGRLKSDYRYSKDIVYNNFPWPEVNDDQKKKIETTAQAILEARELFPDCSLADLYDELTMPYELRKAHQANDRAVMQAYGFNIRETTEESCVAELMKMYQALVDRQSD